MCIRAERGEIRMNRQEVRRTLRLLKKLNLGLESDINADMTELGVTAAQCDVLAYLMSRAGQEVGPTDLHRDLGISKAAVSALLKKLRGKGLLNVEADPQDDRRKRICLLPEAWKLNDQLDGTADRLLEGLYRGFTEEEERSLLSLLQRMYVNLKFFVKEEANL